MTAEDFCRMALALEGASEGSHMAWRLRLKKNGSGKGPRKRQQPKGV